MLVAALVLVPTVSAEAADVRGGERVSVTGEAIADDLYVGGGTVNSTVGIIGDLFAGGGNVMIDGEVSEDLHAAGGSVSVLSEVLGAARVVGGSVTVTGSVGQDLIVLGGQTQLSGEGVGGDLIWGGGVLTLTSPVAGDLRLYGEEVYINSAIAGDVEFYGKKLVLQEGASIAGNLTYEAPNEADIQDGAAVAGEISYEQSSDAASGIDKDAFFAVSAAAVLLWLLIRAAGALIIGLGLPRFTRDLTEKTFAAPWTELGRGLVGLIATPIAVILLMLTAVGMPFGLLALLLYGVFLIMAMLTAPIILGSLIRKWISKSGDYSIDWMTILLGVIVFVVLDFIPVLGGLIQFGFILLALGATMQIIWGIARNYHTDASDSWL